MAAKPVPPRPAPRLYLATPEVDDPSQLASSLPGLLAAADVAAVLVRLKQTDQRTMIARAKALAPAICSHVRAGGQLALSGILAEQADELIACYSPYLTLRVADTRDGWVCLAGIKG